MAPHGDTDWWPELVNGGDAPGRRVFLYQTPVSSWSSVRSIAAANPLMWSFPDSRATLIQEREDALKRPNRADTFKRFRCNLPGGDPATMLLSPEGWKEVLQREVARPIGRPVVGIDLGTAPSWSAAVAIWPSGLVAAIGTCPGLPSLSAQEKRDRAPRGLYQRLVDDGALRVAHDRRAPSVAALVDRVIREWQPRLVIGDRVRGSELRDAVAGRCQLAFRIARWSESSEDIGAFRRLALDGGMSIGGTSPLDAHVLASARPGSGRTMAEICSGSTSGRATRRCSAVTT